MDSDFAFSIHTGSAEPIYRQLVEHVRRRIPVVTGVFLVGWRMLVAVAQRRASPKSVKPAR